MDNYIIMDVETNLPFEYPIDEYASIEYLNSLANVAWNKAHAYFDAYRVPECISRYFDYDALEADLEQDGYYEADGGTIEIY